MAAGLAKGLSGAASQLIKPNTRMRLGGREERRIVYQHYVQCAVRAHRAILDFSGLWRLVTVRWRADAKAERAMAQARDALNEATVELFLVGNASVVDAGANVSAALRRFVFHRSKDAQVNQEASRHFWSALDTFVIACQKDLYYLPRWWQVWRPAWWGVRWRALSRRREVRRELAQVNHTY